MLVTRLRGNSFSRPDGSKQKPANEVIPVRSTNGIDVSVGAVRRDGVERALADGPFAILTVTAQDAAPVHLVVERALVRRSDGSFVPLAAQSGVLTLEAP